MDVESFTGLVGIGSCKYHGPFTYHRGSALRACLLVGRTFEFFVVIQIVWVVCYVVL